MKQKTRLIYILAASHSGSTLLAFLLGSHPEVCTVGELKSPNLGEIDRYRCSCRALIKECPFWVGISQDMQRRGFPFDMANTGTDLTWEASPYVRRLLRPLHRDPLVERIRDIALALSPRWRSRLPQIQARNAALAECVGARTGKRIIVDSSKVGLRLKYLLRNPALEVQVIRLMRDGRAVTLAYVDPANFADARDPSFRSGGTGSGRAPAHLSLERGAREWRRSTEEADAIVKHLDPSQWRELRYETLCAQPEVVLQELFTFLGADPGKATLDFRCTEHHIIGNGMRMDSTSEIRLDDRWKSVLTTRDLEIFNSVAGATNRHLGYH